MASDGTEEIEIVETWKVIDQWWKSDPVVHYWAALLSPDGHRVAVRYSPSTQHWTVHEEPND